MKKEIDFMKKVVIVNKFGPTGKAITGRSAKEVADFLHAHDIDVTYISLASEYKSKDFTSSQQEVTFNRIELRDYYNGRNSFLRLLWGFIDGFRLWRASAKQKAEVIIVMTDPPLLFFWFQWLKRFTKGKLFYWTMDLYPDAFAAGNYIKPSSIFYKFFNSIIYGRLPDLIIALGDKQLEFLEKKFKHPVNHVILPCGIIPAGENSGSTNIEHSKIKFSYGGNIGEAHDAAFLISLIKQLDPQKHEITLSLYGSKAADVMLQVKDAKVVVHKDFLSYHDIASMDVNVASILPEWNHICVPSKAVTAICCGSPLLLNTTKETDAWNMFNDASWLIEKDNNYELIIKGVVDSISREDIIRKRSRTKELAELLIANKLQALGSILLAISQN